MSLPRYPEYKDSGVAWLGEVPEHWKTSPLKAVSTHNDDVLDETTAPDAEIAYVDISSVDGVNGIKTKEAMLFSAAPSRARRRVKHGDVIVSTVRTYLKAIARIRDPEENLIVSTGFAVIRPRGELTPDFLGCLVSASYFVDQVISRSTGVSYPAINASELVAIPVPVPPVAEQTQIAAFLDRETAKIDELVAEQRRLMELLKEKRQAVISHAVTQGLNPHAPMKPSGIEWLGDVPAHWDVMSLRRCASSVQTGGTPSTEPPSTDLEEGLVWFTPGDFSDSLFLTNSTRKISSEVVASGEAKVFPPRSVLIVSIGATLGKVGFTKESSSANQQINAVIPNERIDGYFLAYSLLVKAEVMRFLSNASTIGIMNQEKTKDIWLAVPPTNEQINITAFLDTETAKLDTLTTEAQRAIDLLQERRTALISAAVTGQIDVRRHTGPSINPDNSLEKLRHSGAYVTPCRSTG